MTFIRTRNRVAITVQQTIGVEDMWNTKVYVTQSVIGYILRAFRWRTSIFRKNWTILLLKGIYFYSVKSNSSIVEEKICNGLRTFCSTIYIDEQKMRSSVFFQMISFYKIHFTWSYFIPDKFATVLIFSKVVGNRFL